MTVENENSNFEHEFPDGKRLNVGERVDGRFGWWIDAPGSETKLLRFGGRSSACMPYPRGLLEGEEPTFDAAVRSGENAWRDSYGNHGE